jgi:hypothetical protein
MLLIAIGGGVTFYLIAIWLIIRYEKEENLVLKDKKKTHSP